MKRKMEVRNPENIDIREITAVIRSSGNTNAGISIKKSAEEETKKVERSYRILLNW